MIDSSTLPKPVNALSIYHSMDMGKQTTEYTTGFIYDSPQQERPGFVI